MVKKSSSILRDICFWLPVAVFFYDDRTLSFIFRIRTIYHGKNHKITKMIWNSYDQNDYKCLNKICPGITQSIVIHFDVNLLCKCGRYYTQLFWKNKPNHLDTELNWRHWLLQNKRFIIFHCSPWSLSNVSIIDDPCLGSLNLAWWTKRSLSYWLKGLRLKTRDKQWNLLNRCFWVNERLKFSLRNKLQNYGWILTKLSIFVFVF